MPDKLSVAIPFILCPHTEDLKGNNKIDLLFF